MGNKLGQSRASKPDLIDMVRSTRIRETLPIALITVAALIIRAYGAGSGFPNLLDEGERDYVGQALSMLAKLDFRPDRFFKTVTFAYMLVPPLAVTGAYLLGGFLLGVSDSPVFLEMWRYFFVARAVGIVFGVAAVPVLYLLGKELFNRWVGLIAATFLVFYPNHVDLSQRGIPYSANLFFALLSLLFIAKVYKAGRNRDYVIAGLAAGFSIAIQYNTVPLLVPLVLAHCLHGLRSRFSWRHLFLSWPLPFGLISAGLGFLVGNPFALVDPRRFFDAVLMHVVKLSVVATGSSSAGLGDAPKAGVLATLLGNSGSYIREMASPADMGLPILLVCIAGLVWALYKKSSAALLLLSCIFPTWLIVTWYSTQHISYVLVVSALLFLFGALAIVAAARWIANNLLRQRRRSALAALAGLPCVALLWLPASATLQVKMNFVAKSTFVLAQEWIAQHLPPQGVKMSREEMALPVPGYLVRKHVPLARRPLDWYVKRGYTHLMVYNPRPPYPPDFMTDLEQRTQLLSEFKPRPGVPGSATAIRRLTQPAAQPPLDQASDVIFGEQLKLRGYEIDQRALRPGDKFNVALQWQALADISRDYSFAIGVERAGSFIIRVAQQPSDGFAPTRHWRAGQIIIDDQDYVVPKAEMTVSTDSEHQKLLHPDLRRGFNANLGRLGNILIKSEATPAGQEVLRLTLERAPGGMAVSTYTSPVQIYATSTAAKGTYNVWLEVLDEGNKPLPIAGSTDSKLRLGAIEVID